MEILIALYELENFFGGVQTWSLTMYHALKKLGHTVSLFTYRSRINKAYENLPFIHNGAFDLILCSSNVALREIGRFRGRKIFISHGILPRLEQPVKGADIYIAVSEESAKNCKTKGFPVSKIIRNPIDCDRLHSSACQGELKTIAFLDRRRRFVFIDEIKKCGFEVLEIGRPPIPRPEEYIMKADLVVTRGRGAYEAMAMGKNVIVSGNNSGRSKIEIMDGFVDNETFFRFRQNNLSGRYNQIQVSSVDIFLKEIERYNQKQGALNRNLIIANNNSKDIAKQFLELI